MRKREIERYRDTEIQRYRDTEIQRYRDREIQRYRDTEIERYRDSEIEREREKERESAIWTLCNTCGLYLPPKGVKLHIKLKHMDKKKCSFCEKVFLC